MKLFTSHLSMIIPLMVAVSGCKKDDHPAQPVDTKIAVENVLQGKPLVQSGTFQQSGEAPVTLTGQKIVISFSAAKNQRLTFATIYILEATETRVILPSGNGSSGGHGNTAINQFPDAGITQLNLLT